MYEVERKAGLFQIRIKWQVFVLFFSMVRKLGRLHSWCFMKASGLNK